MENDQLNQHICEYLQFNNYTNTLECFEAETKAKKLSSKFAPKKTTENKNEKLPKLYEFLNNESSNIKPKEGLENELRVLTKQYNQVHQAGRQIFQVALSCLQLLHQLKESSKNEQLAETFENYKIQLGKYHKVIINEGRPEGEELISEKILQEHKVKLISHYNHKNIEGIIEMLLSLRVNALQIAPELRKNLVYELIRNDIFLITENGNVDFLMGLLEINNNALKHAITSLVSVVCSAYRGVEYITPNNKMTVIERIIRILKDQENGSVTQRFCVAILQKCSVNEDIVPVLVAQDVISWIFGLLNRSLHQKIHIFCLDFASATLANIIHCPTTLQFLQNNLEIAGQIMKSMLRLIKENIPSSVQMHLLVSLSYFSRDCFQAQLDECQFIEQINEYVEQYSKTNTTENEAAEIDKRTILDLCAIIFHPKDPILDNSQLTENSDLKPKYKIKEYENEAGELIFECFQDEVS